MNAGAGVVGVNAGASARRDSVDDDFAGAHDSVDALSSARVARPVRVIVDTDPGIDDIAAIVPLLAAPEVDVRLIATVSGNVGVAQTTRNALATLAYLREHDARAGGVGEAGVAEAGMRAEATHEDGCCAGGAHAAAWWHVPVARGAARPLLREPVYVPGVHGSDGVGGFPLPDVGADALGSDAPAAITGVNAAPSSDSTAAMSPLLAADAVAAEARVLAQAAADGTTVDILALGPLTNIALLLRDHPDETKAIRRIVLMGGSFGPRYDWACDFNIAVDPEAAAIVFGSGLPIVMVGVEIGRKATLPPDLLARLDAQGPAGHMVASMFASYDDGAVVSGPGVQMYDPTTALYLLDPGLFVTARAHVDVDALEPLPSPVPSAAGPAASAHGTAAGAAAGTRPPRTPDLLKSTTAVDFDAEPSARRNVTVAIDINVERFRDVYLRRMAAADRALTGRVTA